MTTIHETGTTEPKIVYFKIKRAFDVLLAAALCLPLFIIIISLLPFYRFGAMKGPLFFKQIRIGQHGEPFMIYKFRSMPSSQVLAPQNTSFKQPKELQQELPLFGRIIRATSIDEIPQLINVLKGEMSIIGPRPIVKKELSLYKQDAAELLCVKPGITGYWQVNGRSNVSYPARAELELFYARHCSIWMDLKILCKTIYVVLLRIGAY